MTTTTTEATYTGWAIVELMGHRRLGAYVTEVELPRPALPAATVDQNEAALDALQEDLDERDDEAEDFIPF